MRSVAVEVVYASPGAQLRIPLSVPDGTTVAQAIARSGILARCPEIDLGRNQVGIYGARCDPGQRLVGDERVRIEIYRPLLRDPKELRRARAARKR